MVRLPLRGVAQKPPVLVFALPEEVVPGEGVGHQVRRLRV